MKKQKHVETLNYKKKTLAATCLQQNISAFDSLLDLVDKHIATEAAKQQTCLMILSSYFLNAQLKDPFHKHIHDNMLCKHFETSTASFILSVC